MILLMQLAYLDEKTGRVNEMLRFQSNADNPKKIVDYRDVVIRHFQEL